MKKRFIASIFFALATMAAPASAQLYDFESFAAGTVISGPGVFTDFELSSDTSIVVSSSIPGPVFGGARDARGVNFTHASPFRADFLIGGVNSVSVVMGDFDQDADNLFLRAFSSSDVLLAETTFALGADVFGGPNLTVLASNIAYVLFGSTGTFANSVYFDNISVQVIPEPEIYAMLVAGLGLMGFVARRRKQAAAA